MTAAGPLVFPGGRVLAGWWQQLAPIQPQALGVAHLLLHWVEALVWVSRPHSLDSFARLVLEALTLRNGSTLLTLEEHLHLGPQVLQRVLARLQKERLARRGAAGDWLLTPLGRHALEQGGYPSVAPERRGFFFVENRLPDGRPHFLNLGSAGSDPWPNPESWSFDVRLLEDCVQRSPEWKQSWGFPLDVEGIVGPSGTVLASPGTAAGGDPASPVAAAEDGTGAAGLPFPTPLAGPSEWQRVILDRPQQLFAALVRVADAVGGQQLWGYLVRPEGWVLQAEQPAFRVGADWPSVFPELSAEPPPEVWQQAWRSWAQGRRLPPAEVESCSLERCDHRLRVQAGTPLMDRLRAARSEALRGEVWLLAGSGHCRTAALLELVETPA